MKMLKTLTLVGALAAGSSAMATQITGTVQFGSPFGSTVTLSPAGPFTGVTSVDFSNNSTTATVNAATDDFVAIGGLPAAFKDFTTGASVLGLWKVSTGSGDWVFDLDSAANVSNPLQPNFLSIKGTGTVSAPGFQPTSGVFTFQVTGNSSDVNFAFTSSTTAIPDGGATIALLGVGLLGLGALRRKL